MNISDRTNSWARYWALGHLHSCPTSWTDHYGPAVQGFWRKVLDQAQWQGRLVDLACGNGSLIRFALQNAPAESVPECHGIDIAKLNPAWQSDIVVPARLSPRVFFHGETGIEKLPFEDGHFDVVCSQFGIEYVDSDAMWAEIFRVASAQAQLAFVMHHRDSLLAGIANDERQVCEAATQPGGLIDAADALLPFLAKAATEEGRRSLASNPAAEAARSRFNDSVRTMQLLAGRLSKPDSLAETMDAIQGVCASASSQGLDQALARLAGVRQAIGDNLLRVSDLVENAQGPDEMSAIKARIDAAGFAHCNIERVTESQGLVAWSVHAWR